jgi:peptidoglycan hydrolase-like protein with peptidoglycan-binding domain
MSNPTLTPGSTDPAVKTLQTALNLDGAGLTVDGVYGPLTLGAVIMFKLSHHLTDGIVGPMTWAALKAV